MHCLTSICYVCLKTTNKSLVNINSTLSVNRDILDIIGYLPCDLAWLKTKQIILICNECCLRLREIDEFLTACFKNSAVLRGYMAKLNTVFVSNADNEVEHCADTEQEEKGETQCEINLELEAIFAEDTMDAFVNVEDSSIQTISSIQTMVDGEEESQMDNSFNSGSGRGRKRTSADSSAHRDEDTSGGSGIAKKSKKDIEGTGNNTGNGAVTKATDTGKEAADLEAVWAGKGEAGGAVEVWVKSVTAMLTKTALEQCVVEEQQPEQEEQQQQQLQQEQLQEQQEQQLQKLQRKILKMEQRKLLKSKKIAFRNLLKQINLHGNSTYEHFANVYGQDERFQAVTTVASPQNLFEKHVNRVRKREMKAAKRSQRQDQVTSVNSDQQQAREQEQQQQQQQLQEQRKQLYRQSQSETDNFRNLLAHINLHGNSTYEHFAKEYGEDERLKNVTKWASPEDLFHKHVNRLRELEAAESLRQGQVSSMNNGQQQEQQQQQQEQPTEQPQQHRVKLKPKVEYRKLLAEAHLHGGSTYYDFVKEYGQDARFKKVFKRNSRVGMFRLHVCELRKREMQECQQQEHSWQQHLRQQQEQQQQHLRQQQHLQQQQLRQQQLQQSAYHSNHLEPQPQRFRWRRNYNR